MKVSSAEIAAKTKQQEADGRVLRGVLLDLHQNQIAINRGMEDPQIVGKIISRMYHDRLVRLNTVILDTDKPLNERVATYMTDEHDATYGRAMAYRFGLTLTTEQAANYDVLKYTGDMRIFLDGDALIEMVRYFRSIGAVVASPKISPTTDGINHVNVYSHGKTSVGRELSNFSSYEANTPFGKFASLEGYYHWLRIADYHCIYCDEAIETMEIKYPEISRLRTVTGTEAISVGRRCKQLAYDNTGYRPGKFTGTYFRHFVTALIHKLFKPYNGTTLGAYTSELIVDGFTLLHYYTVSSENATDGMMFPKHGEWLPNLIEFICADIDPAGGSELASVLVNVDKYIEELG